MVDTYSNDKTRVVNQTEGGNPNNWGQILDANFEALARASAGYLSKAITGNVTLTLTESQNAFIRLTGTLSAAAIVEVPAYSGAYIIQNATTGGFKVTVKTSAAAGIDVNNGARRWLFCDGTDVISVQTALQADQNLADLANAATARTNLGLGALAVLSSVGAGQIDADAIGASELAPDSTAWENLVAGIFNQTAVAPAANDKIVGADTSASGAKTVFTIGDILALVPSGSTATLAHNGNGVSPLDDATGPDYTIRGFDTNVAINPIGSGNGVSNVTVGSQSWSVAGGALRFNLTLNVNFTNFATPGGGGS